MKALCDWIREFVEVAAAGEELRERLSMAGIAVDAVEESPAGPVLEVDLTTNRPDCLSHYGLAREVAALYRTRLRPVEVRLEEARARAADETRVEIACPELCGRYTARVLRGVRVAPSPDWLRRRLEALGQASINNVVDATNYVMFELGHPLHAFDLEQLAERRIVVRRARTGETIRTLDGVERKLTPEMCVIADAGRAVAIGGVMGGAETEIGFTSKNILLESAWFDPLSIRKTAKGLGLRTEASIRFDRGADPEMAELASRRTAALIRELAGGEILAGVIDVYPRPWAGQEIELTRKELLRVMGADVPDGEIEAILEALGFQPRRTDHNRTSAGTVAARWQCRRPSWRGDVAREIDLIEEVARHYGFGNFPARLPAARQPAQRLPHAAAEDRLRERLRALGYHEIVTMPLVDPARDALFRPPDFQPVQLANPLAEDASRMRSTGLVNMLQALEWNLNRGQRDLRLFEIGQAYRLDAAGRAEETPIVTLGATGMAREKSVHEAGRAFSFADLKGDLESLGELCPGMEWQPGAPPWLTPDEAATICLAVGADPGGPATDERQAVPSPFPAEGPRAIGVAGRLAHRPRELLKLRQDVFVAELELIPLLEACERAAAALRFRPIPRFPAVERDFSLLLAEEVTFAEVRQAIEALAIRELVRVEAVDLFRGLPAPASSKAGLPAVASAKASGQVPQGKYSLLVRVAFQSPEATLTEAQVNDWSARIVAALVERLGATLRTA
jgi:phenylalanyl-tRNA synthetase beta chain